MKKRVLVAILSLAAILPVIFATSCYFDNDFYGVYENPDRTVSLTLREKNFASITYNDNSIEYYAEYIIYQNKILLRDAKDGFNGKVRKTFEIDQSDITKLTLVEYKNTVDENGVVTVSEEPTKTVFTLNKSY